jgi:Flp pilus assembly protein TadG
MRTSPNGLYRYHPLVRIIEVLPAPLKLETTHRNSMLLRTPPRATPPPALPMGAPRPVEHGQAMVEFAMVLLPLLVVVVGIIQFGLIFGANVSLTNAAREGAREATIHRYNAANGNAAEGTTRCTEAVEAATSAFGFLSTSGPNFSASTPCPGGVDLNGDGLHDLWQNGDVEVSFCAGGTPAGSECPTTSDASTYCTVDSGRGCLVRVQLTYNQVIVVPLLDRILDADGNGLFEVRADAAMVIN